MQDGKKREEMNRNMMVSPDGNPEAFIRDHNLWIRHLESNKQTQLTNDGVKDFGYVTNNADWTKNDWPVLLWSPDSKKIATLSTNVRIRTSFCAKTNIPIDYDEKKRHLTP